MTTRKEGRVFVVGNGMTKFFRPGREDTPDYPELAKLAVQRALSDANISYSKIEQAVVGYVFGDSTSGQRALYEVGMTGIPVYNVNNNCSTGATAMHIASRMISGGLVDCVLALGFDKMEKGSLKSGSSGRANPLEKHVGCMLQIKEYNTKAPFAPQIFGNAGLEHMEKYGTKNEHFAKIAFKNHLHSVNNPYSQFRDKYTLEEIMKSPHIHGPLTKLQCCPTSDGAAAAILCSEKFMIEHGLTDQAVEILAISLRTDFATTFTDNSLMKIAGSDISKAAAADVYKKSGVNPSEIGVVELHDCFSANELITYEALQLCPEGKAGEYIDKDYFTYGGKTVVNPSGGLISKGHPLGATGLAQCAELCWQLRGMAQARQVKGLKYALQHNLGLGGACVVALYQKYNDKKGWVRDSQSSDPAVLEKLEKEGTSVVRANTSAKFTSPSFVLDMENPIMKSKL